MNRSPTVLYVDYSIGFGGAPKSLSLLLGALPNVRRILITTQTGSFAKRWFPDTTYYRFRRFINHRTRSWLSAFLNRWRVPSMLRKHILRSYAALDAMAGAIAGVRILYLIKIHNVDLVHANNGFTPSEALWAARIAGVPSIVHLRGMAVAPFTSAELRASRGVACTIAVSDAAVADLRNAQPSPATVTIYDPVDVERVEGAIHRRAEVRAAIGIHDSDVAVGIFGRVVPWKGQREFLEALLLALEKEPRIVGLIVGDVSDGANEYIESLRELVRRSKIGSRVIFTGYHEDVEGLYSAVDITVHASIEPEPFGMVIPESMAAGKPVIAANQGGPLEIVTDGYDGFQVNPRDPKALAAAILRLARDSDLRNRMGRRGMRTVRQRFTVEKTAADVTNLYRRILTESRGAARCKAATSAEF